MSTIIGIDLGTTNSLISFVDSSGKPVIIANSQGSNLMSSSVRIKQDGTFAVGNEAYRGRILDPLNTITSIKRFIGRKYNEVFDLAVKVPYKVVAGENDQACVEAHNTHYSPQVISAVILSALRIAAEHYLGEKVSEAVITVPAYFNEEQKIATKIAGELAGLNVRRMINEPTAAAMAYGLDKQDRDMKIAVFDLGGGTFDISIMETGDGVFEVKSIDGDGFLGGDDFNQALEKWLIREIKHTYEIDPSGDYKAMERLKMAVDIAKLELSQERQTQIRIPFFQVQQYPMVHIDIGITRDQFEDTCEELFDRLIPPCSTALKNAGMSSSDIDKVILVGGATRMPKVTEIVRKIFRKEPTRSINPDEAVALGAAVQGGVLLGDLREILLLDVTSHSYGIATADEIMFPFVEANTTLPTKKTETFSTIEDNQTSVELNILQGDHHLARDNKSLGYLVLSGIRPQPAGVPKIEVIFDFDANYLLRVTVRDKETGIQETLHVDARSRLTPEAWEEGVRIVRQGLNDFL